MSKNLVIVESPAPRLVVEREKEIEKFEGKSSFKITRDFVSAGPKLCEVGYASGVHPV